MCESLVPPARLPRNPASPAGIASLLLLALLAMPGCKPPTAPQTPPPVVQSMVVTATNVQAHVETIGQLDSPQNVEIRARVEGFVEKIHFTEGREVREGDLLFSLDAKPYQEKLAAAEGALAEARASLNKYQRDVARLRPLAEKRAIPQQDLENAGAAVEVGKAAVLSAEARVASAKLDLGYCQVHAPVAGLIGASQATVGSLVGRGQPTLLATLSQLDPIWFYCAISEVDYLKAERKALESGRRIADIPATLILSDGTELPTPGRWVFIDRAVDAATGTLRARAEFANTNKLLRPGMFARVRVPLRNTQPTIVIPQRAIQELQGRNFVWVLSGGDNGSPSISSQRPVRIGSRIGSQCTLEEGLEPGERIIVEGLNKVREGAPVMALTAEQFAARAGEGAAAKSSAAKE